MTPRERGIRRLNQDASKALVTYTIIGMLFPAFGMYLVLTQGHGGDWDIQFYTLLTFIMMGVCIARGVRDRRAKLLEVNTLGESKPFAEAYRNGSILILEKSLRSESERRELREKYHRLKGLIENQIRSHKNQKEAFQYAGKIEDVQGMTALIVDLEDAEKQLQKELALIERGYQPIQTPQVIADPPPVTRLKPSRETGLEDY